MSRSTFFRSRTGAVSTAALVLVALAATRAQAGCADDIAALEQQSQSAGRAAIATSSGGQKDAAIRGGQAQQSQQTDKPVGDLPKAKASAAGSGGVAASEAANAASHAGEGVMAAKVSLNEARNALKKGDEAACKAAVAKARTQLKG